VGQKRKVEEELKERNDSAALGKAFFGNTPFGTASTRADEQHSTRVLTELENRIVAMQTSGVDALQREIGSLTAKLQEADARCERLIGEKMELKTQLTVANETIRKTENQSHKVKALESSHKSMESRLKDREEQILKLVKDKVGYFSIFCVCVCVLFLTYLHA